MWREKKKGKKWEEINTSKVVQVKYLNLDVHLLWKDLGVKLGKDYRKL
jgi:hypothetical protein